MKDKNPRQFGWVIVGVSFITLSLTYGVWYSFSVFFVALLKEFGWSRSIAAGAFSLCMIIHNLMGPFVGGMVDRLGARRVILIGSSFLGTGLALCSFTQTWWHFYLFFGVITAIGIGTTGWVPNVTLIQQWFKVNKGLAIGIISSGIGIGIVACVPAVQYLVLQLGWRMTYRIMAIFIPLSVMSMAVAFLKKSPPTAPLQQSQIEMSLAITKDPLVIYEEWNSQPWTVRSAVTTKQFWLLGSSFFLSNFIAQSILTHQVAFFVDHGLETFLASSILGMVGLVSVGAKILWGSLSDKIGREIPYTMGIGCAICGVILLIFFSVFPSSGVAYFFALFFGMGYAVTAALPPLISADFFEGRAYGGIFGSIMLINGTGGALGVWFAGFLFDQIGSYVPFFVILIAFCSVSCMNIWWVAPRKMRRVPGKVKQVFD
jgi:MFS family permease